MHPAGCVAEFCSRWYFRIKRCFCNDRKSTEKINRLCKCAACFFVYTRKFTRWQKQTAILLITEGGMGYEREAYPYGSAQGSDP